MGEGQCLFLFLEDVFQGSPPNPVLWMQCDGHSANRVAVRIQGENVLESPVAWEMPFFSLFKML